MPQGRRWQGDVHSEEGSITSGRRQRDNSPGHPRRRFCIRRGQRPRHRRQSHRQQKNGQRQIRR